MNVFPDLGRSPRSGSPDGVMTSGTRYDVKASKLKEARLLSTLKVNPDVDVYVLCIVEGSTLDFKGWAFKKDLIREENITALGHGPGLTLRQDNLTPFGPGK